MSSRRDFLKKAGYAAPVVMTLSVRPSFAGQGSQSTDDTSPAQVRRKNRRVKRRRGRRDDFL